MRSFKVLGGIIALANTAYAQVDSTSFCDASTKICYQSYTNPDNLITFRVALPFNVTVPYDAIVQIVAPKDVPWVGFAWGGTMVFNPLTVAWANGASTVPSSRFAFGFSQPSAYEDATLFPLKGSGVNATHWTMTALCRGCTSWIGSEATLESLDGNGTAQFAWAKGGSAVQEPANNNTNFNVHESFGKWTHDLNAARSDKFSSWVAANLPPTATTTAKSSTFSTIRATSTSSTVRVSVTSKAPSATTSPAAGAIPSTCNAGSAKYSSVLAAGWKATKVLGGLTSPRSIVFDTAGNMLIVQSGKGITVHKMDSNGCVTSSKTLISQNNLNHGIQLSPDSKSLYASSATQVYRWAYDPATMAVTGSSTVVIKGLFTGIHSTRTLLLAPHRPELLVVSHGSNDNWDYATGNPKTGRSLNRVFDMSKVPSGGYSWVNDGWLGGYGMRNDVGICFDSNNMLWGVENSGDNFVRKVGSSSTDVHIDNPAEELHYVGDITSANNKWFGYPTCFTVWNPSSFTDKKFQVGDQFVVTPNSTYNDDSCKGQSTPASLAFQAHSAPIDCKFDADSSNLYVTFHGSWNRSPTTGFRLVVVPMKKSADGTIVPVAPITDNKGYSDIMANPRVESCQGNGPSASSGCFRPAGLAWDSSKRLYMTSDLPGDGEIWVLGKS